MIFDYQSSNGSPMSLEEHHGGLCRYCRTKMAYEDAEGIFKPELDDIAKSHRQTVEDMVEYAGEEILLEKELTGTVDLIGSGFASCPACGWWAANQDLMLGSAHQVWYSSYGYSGELVELDLADIRAPIGEVREYITARYDLRNYVNPRRFEEVVASVLSDHGYHATVTSFSNDGGVDIILRNTAQAVIAVQVKRHNGKIKAEQIRSFVGAIVLNGQTRGIFVTTSDYQKGARVSANRAGDIGMQITLINSDGFLELLKEAQKKSLRGNNFREHIFHLNNRKMRYGFEYHLNSL